MEANMRNARVSAMVNEKLALAEQTASFVDACLALSDANWNSICTEFMYSSFYSLVDQFMVSRTSGRRTTVDGSTMERYNTNELEEGHYELDISKLKKDDTIQNPITELLEGKTRKDGLVIQIGENGLNINNIYAVNQDGVISPEDYNEELIYQIVDTVLTGSEKDYNSLCVASNTKVNGVLVPLCYMPSDKLTLGGIDANNSFLRLRNGDYVTVEGKKSNIILWDHNSTYVFDQETKFSKFMSHIPLIGHFFKSYEKVYLNPYHNFQHETFHAGQRSLMGIEKYKSLCERKTFWNKIPMNEDKTMKAKRWSKRDYLSNMPWVEKLYLKTFCPEGTFDNYRHEYRNTDYIYDSNRFGVPK